MITFSLLAALATVPPPDARPLFAAHCFDCHSGDTRRGGLALDKLLDAPDPAADRRTWEKVWKTVRHEFMPPADADPVPPADRQAISRWIERTAFKADPVRPDPGRVTIRRLNRTEYRYTVRDRYSAHGLRMVDGKLGSLGELGKCCVSSASDVYAA